MRFSRHQLPRFRVVRAAFASVRARGILRNFAQIALSPSIFCVASKKIFGLAKWRRREKFSASDAHAVREKIFLRTRMSISVACGRARIFFRRAGALRLAGRINTGLARTGLLLASCAAANG